MIHAVLVFNNSGKTRLARFYTALPLPRRQGLIDRVYGVLRGRHFATLYFAFIVDHTESDLATLDLIQVFVQALDTAFDSVCELDLVYHFDKANYVLDEVVMGGLVLESNIDTIKMALREAA
ncbi:clathrin assembly protein AP19, putative [Perkinsus marinus ATCC 50983]|uniref:AP complex subunit sigma n=1 Tax=Perkinsus marinus (strain ATCC 50983 / TXsc) TaxID=423536 RepID=C5L7D6_PERM5|nr:clathrin assembly protein AP19, putative [Perkinsus marinus ATCC 50983]EER07398.1 clathrin assembly protein AP19, putative [Perkinsus marinus ATCC 50983]|eukprot:XP_002775582.1 clathrin assembly protein AP19, putative [Perkinsus marinus ATCC 50983]